MNISDRIRARLHEKRENLSWLAIQAGVTRPGLQKMMNSSVFRTDTLALIAKALEVPVSVLLGEEPVKEAHKSGEDFLKELLIIGAFMAAVWQLDRYLKRAYSDPTLTKEQILKDIEEQAQKMLELLFAEQKKVGKELADTVPFATQEQLDFLPAPPPIGFNDIHDSTKPKKGAKS